MTDIETVINGLNDIGGFIAGRVGFEQARNFLRTIDETIELLKEQEKQKFFVDENGKITPLPVVVRCKDCKWAEASDSQYTWCDHVDHDVCHYNDWFCADGKRKDS